MKNILTITSGFGVGIATVATYFIASLGWPGAPEFTTPWSISCLAILVPIGALTILFLHWISGRRAVSRAQIFLAWLASVASIWGMLAMWQSHILGKLN